MRAVSAVLAVLVVALCLACGGGGTPATKPRRASEASVIDAVELHARYKADKDAVLKEWGGQTVEVAGKVAIVYTDHDKPRLMLAAGPDTFLACWFHKSRQGELEALRAAQPVRVVGVLTGRVDAGLTLEDCRLAD